MQGDKCYCRYCVNAHLIDDDIIWCGERNTTLSGRQITRQRSCKHFDFNPLDVLSDLENLRYYKPKKQKTSDMKQLKFI